MKTSSLPSLLLLLSLSSNFLKVALSEDGGGLFCSAPSVFKTETASFSSSKPRYWKVTNPTLSPSHLQDLPGFTRSVYKRDHALITPESHVFSPLPEWTNTLGAYLITPAMGSHFVMYLAKMQGLLPPFSLTIIAFYWTVFKFYLCARNFLNVLAQPWYWLLLHTLLLC
ncbi:hypothetical protein OIU84_004453 [Salix udensis]|uniref:GPI mannosyltransferase 2 n=1 Tax=Salix udensis TaxID=889485 RepID=A0AAD6K261_9ROSI|nr:hypothetical protein OIU84_004453 [Salix udensis]